MYTHLFPPKILYVADGAALHTAVAGLTHRFDIVFRDAFGNLVVESESYPSIFAVGPEGIILRGSVKNMGGGTYMVEYLPKKSGSYRLSVTIGCCSPHPVR